MTEQTGGTLNATPKRGTVFRYKDTNTGEAEKTAICRWCGTFIEDWGGEWRHSDTDAPRCDEV